MESAHNDWEFGAAERHRRRTIIGPSFALPGAVAMLVGIAFGGGGCARRESDEPEAARPTFANPQILQFRIIAGTVTDPIVCERAKSQQDKDTALGRPWSAEVYRDPDTRQDVSARWYPCDADFATLAADNADYLLRELPDRPGLSRSYEVLVMADNFNIDRNDIGRVREGLDANDAPCVYFEMTRSGAKKLSTLTSRRLPSNGRYSYIAIVFDGTVISAPRLNEVIGERGQITGNFTFEEVEHLVDLCNITHVARPRATPSPTPVPTPRAGPLGTGVVAPTPVRPAPPPIPVGTDDFRPSPRPGAPPRASTAASTPVRGPAGAAAPLPASTGFRRPD